MQFLMTAVVKIDVVADAGGGVAGAIEHAPGLVGGEFSFVPRRDAIDADDGYLVGYLTHCTTLQSYCVVRPPPPTMHVLHACLCTTHSSAHSLRVFACGARHSGCGEGAASFAAERVRDARDVRVRHALPAVYCCVLRAVAAHAVCVRAL